MLLENNKQNIDIKKYFILCKLILILKNDTINILQEVYWNNLKIFFQIDEKKCINDIGNAEIKESLQKFDEYEEKIINESIIKNLKNYFGENINIKEQINQMENSDDYEFTYGYLYAFLRNLKDSEEKNIISLQNFMELIISEEYNDYIFKDIFKYINEENDKNKKIIETGKIDIYNKKISSIEQLNKDKIIIYFDKKLQIYSSNDLSLLYTDFYIKKWQYIINYFRK